MPARTTPHTDALGRAATRLLLGALMLLILAPMIARWVHGEFAGIGIQLLTLLATAFLLRRVYAGSGAARTLTVGLCMLSGVAGVILGMLGTSVSLFGLAVLAVGLGFIGIGLALISYPPVRDFLDRHQLIPRPGGPR
ncbi:hypothetical protein [Deinococcus maricopensis]|uniref:Uncharacterized protein n=1 Tax=Deinococcus maricopensis (strain DSM 21211 / LMG 22137 / NRRL B-23946 / LB-34) TaxID=709986 RepID=E8U9F6_DEIML|nr:hypothetical protein [Deinococcus maricopensis]ADV67695.1 hypothetical protein Deima_2052 [Deinococcus maricopensis DSM 21211]